MASRQTESIECETHGRRTPAIVCRHLVGGGRAGVGFVENSTDPDDLQAWCAACEALFLNEGDRTARFLAFNDFAVVCDRCYTSLRERHGAEHGG